MIEQVEVRVVETDEIYPDTYVTWYSGEPVADNAQPGQFVMLQPRAGLDPFLPRAFSFYRFRNHLGEREFALLYHVVGSATELMAAQKPGDEVTIKYIHKGTAEEKKVVLDERQDLAQGFPGAGIKPMFQGMGNIPEADRKRMQEQMQKHLQQMRKQLEQNGGMQLDLQQLLQGAQQGRVDPKAPKGKARKNGVRFNFKAAASITMMDGQGSVTMKTIDGKKEVIVKDKAGKVEFEGPYQTEQDKAAVPDGVRERLERLNFGADRPGGLRLQLLPGAMVPPPAQPDEDEAAE